MKEQNEGLAPQYRNFIYLFIYLFIFGRIEILIQNEAGNTSYFSAKKS